MKPVMALIMRLFALMVIWRAVVYITINSQIDMDQWSSLDLIYMIFTLVLLLGAILAVAKPKLFIRGIEHTEAESVDNISIYHAGMVTAGMVMLFFSLSDLIQIFSYMIFMREQIDDLGMVVNSQIQATKFSGMFTSVFQLLMSIFVLLGSKRLARTFQNLREAGLDPK